MKVVVNCLSMVSGGGVSYLRNLIFLLARIFDESFGNHCLKVLAHESQKELFPSLPDSQCVWVRGARPTGYRRVLWEYRNIPRIAHEERVDVFFMLSQIGPRVRYVKQVLMLQNMEPFLFMTYPYSPRTRLRNHLLRRQSSHVLRRVDRVIAVSGFVEDQLREGLGISASRVRLIYHGRDAAFSPDGDQGEDRERLKALGVEGDFLLTCGSLLPYRRCEDVIAAFNQCAGSLSGGIKLVIAGSGSDARYADTIRQAIARSPYRNRIIAVGYVSKEAMIALYRRCLTCIIASEIEACPMIAIEAMSSACAIISSDRPPLPEMFAGNSLVFASRDVEDMGRQIRACLSDETLRNEIGRRALQRAQDFSWEKCAEETYTALVEWPKG